MTSGVGGRGGRSFPLGRPVAPLAVAACVLVLSAVAFIRVPLLPSMGRELSMSVADLGLVTTFFALGRLCADIPAGRLLMVRSVPSMLSAAAALLGVASLVLAGVTTAWQVLLTAFFLGVSSAVVNTTGMVYFAELTTVERRGRSMAVFSAALLGGQTLGPALGGLLGSLWDWRVAMLVGGLGAVGVSVAIAARPRHRRPDPARTAPEPSPDVGSQSIRGHERAILHLVPFAVFFTFGSMPQTLLPIIGADRFGLGAGVIGLVLGIGGACRIVGAIAGGTASDRVSRKAALVPALLVQAAGVALLLLEDYLWAWVAAVLVMSLASFGISVAATMLVDLSPGLRAGSRLGPFRFTGDLGLIAGPLSASLVYEQLGQGWAALLVAALLTVTAIASALGLRETRWPSE